MPLLREIVTTSKNTKYYPFKVFPSVCLISSLQSLFSIPDFYNQCEQWRFSFESNSILTDVYCGQVWNYFLNFEDKSF